MKIVIAGNPNSGKTTIFNGLTGKVERIGNWAGVTVEKKEAKLKNKYNLGKHDVSLVDLPGAYALESYTNDEHIATDFLKNEKIDLIINVVDASNLERNLYFTTQLIDTKIPVVIALNKTDIVKKKKITIDVKELENMLGVKIVETKGISKLGFKELMEAAFKIGENNRKLGEQQ